MTTETERAEFEKWAKLGGARDCARTEWGNYKAQGTERLWECWQASARARSGAVPAGYALVPIEPTEEMLLSADAAMMREESHGMVRGRSPTRIWTAMLAAAPEPLQGSADYVLRMLVAAGHVSQAKVDEARRIAGNVVEAPRSGDAPVAWVVRAQGRSLSVFLDEATAADEAESYPDKCGAGAFPCYISPPADARDSEDARRYRWLRGHHDIDMFGALPSIPWCVRVESEFGIRTTKPVFGLDLDAAIDSAMGAGGWE